jgi:hypothetical protein
VRPDHDVLNVPLKVPHRQGRLKVLKRTALSQSGMGEALTLEGIVNSIDAELIAKGLSAKGAERGAIARHGRYTLWAFAGSVDDMTEAGRTLFVNTVFYAAKHADSPVLEKRQTKTRDGAFLYLAKAKADVPGLLRTLQRYLPEEARDKSAEQTERWVAENRPYLRCEGRQFEVDAFAKALQIPNHKRALLECCIAYLENGQQVEDSLATLRRYTGRDDLGTAPQNWRTWYNENKDYLFFSDCDGYRFKIDEEAKARGIPTAKLRAWSSGEVNYRADPACVNLKEKDVEWVRATVAGLPYAQYAALFNGVEIILTCTDYETTDTEIGAVYQDLMRKARTPEALLDELTDPNPARRIMAAAILDSRYGPMRDLAFDALNKAPSVRTRAEQLVGEKR